MAESGIWRNQAYLDIIRGHILYVGIEDKAYRYDVHVNIFQRYGFVNLFAATKRRTLA